jgi:hypothetical protein
MIVAPNDVVNGIDDTDKIDGAYSWEVIEDESQRASMIPMTRISIARPMTAIGPATLSSPTITGGE